MSAEDIKVNVPVQKEDRDNTAESHLIAIDDVTPKEAALTLYEAGFHVIPIIPGQKRPACKHHPWLDELSIQTITNYWNLHPKDEIGCITGDDLLVLDVDSRQSGVSLFEIEKVFDVLPALVVKTNKGEHHYFGLVPGTFAKSDSHNSEKYPDRIDVRTGNGLVIMPPSKGKGIALCEISHANELTEVNQDFVDAIFRHNGREAPRKQIAAPSPKKKPAHQNQTLKELDALINHLDPNCGYEDWITPGMAVHYETDGSDEGLSIFDDWSRQGSNYPGYADIKYKWKSFNNHKGAPVTKATLCKMVTENDHDWMLILDRLGAQFQKCDFVVIELNEEKSKPKNGSPTGFDRFSLRGKANELKTQVQAQKFVLSGIALLGQLTLLYARYNAGKTLLVIYLLIEAIHNGVINGADVYLLNLDDNFKGLIDKLEITDEVGIHTIADGFYNFKPSEFRGLLKEMCTKNRAQGKILILDTVKKFVDLMDKKATSELSQIMRQFVIKGGTIIGLAHVNKNPGQDGQPIHAGTSDLIDDADCAYIMDIISEDLDAQTRTVELVNRKRRGNVANSVTYQYSIEENLSYEELLASVKRVDETDILLIKQAEENKPEAEVVNHVMECIKAGINARMRLRDVVNERAGVSKRRVLNILDKYTGKDPDLHRWFYTTQKHGRKVYQLLS